MVGLPPKYQDVFDWLTAALDLINGNTGTIVLNINGGAIEADLVTKGSELDLQGRKIRVERRTTTHLTIREVKKGASLPLVARRLRG